MQHSKCLMGDSLETQLLISCIFMNRKREPRGANLFWICIADAECCYVTVSKSILVINPTYCPPHVYIHTRCAWFHTWPIIWYGCISALNCRHGGRRGSPHCLCCYDIPAVSLKYRIACKQGQRGQLNVLKEYTHKLHTLSLTPSDDTE